MGSFTYSMPYGSKLDSSRILFRFKPKFSPAPPPLTVTDGPERIDSLLEFKGSKTLLYDINPLGIGVNNLLQQWQKRRIEKKIRKRKGFFQYLRPDT